MEMPIKRRPINRGAEIMGAILDGAFYPNEVEAMSRAHEEVCNALHINGDAKARETIAKRVIGLARRGERRPTVLRDRVLAGERPPVGHVPVTVATCAIAVPQQKRMPLLCVDTPPNDVDLCRFDQQKR
jgi:hypothetical protein